MILFRGEPRRAGAERRVAVRGMATRVFLEESARAGGPSSQAVRRARIRRSAAASAGEAPRDGGRPVYKHRRIPLIGRRSRPPLPPPAISAGSPQTPSNPRVFSNPRRAAPPGLGPEAYGGRRSENSL